MELLATAEQMQGFDRAAIAEYAIPGLVLMENAGRGFVDVLEREIGTLASRRVVILCGKGNNGGDGFVIARHIVNRGGEVSVGLLGKRGEVKGDARANLEIILKMAKQKRSAPAVREISSQAGFRSLGAPDIIVDALFGTGFSGKISGVYAKAVEWANASGAIVASVDIASGVNATSGAVEGIGVRADFTATMGLAKVGQYIGAGRDHSGRVSVVDIGMPGTIVSPAREQAYRVVARDVKRVLPSRPVSAHKYSVGKVFVIAGSRSFTGAPYMCAQAAMRAGCGAVVMAVPASIRTVLARKLTEVILLSVDETPDGTIASAAEPALRERIAWADVVVIGPGMSRHEETDALLLKLIAEIDKPLVVDADGLNALATSPKILQRRKLAAILTPHAGELSRITKQEVRAIEGNRVDAARSAAKQLRSIVCLKGGPTVTASPPGNVFINSTGNAGMATIGSGDVLTGLVAGLEAQGMDALDAAMAGVYLHGLAGDLAATRYGQKSMMALDILEHISSSIRNIEEG